MTNESFRWVANWRNFLPPAMPSYYYNTTPDRHREARLNGRLPHLWQLNFSLDHHQVTRIIPPTAIQHAHP